MAQRALRLPVWIWEYLDREAKATGDTASALVRRAVYAQYGSAASAPTPPEPQEVAHVG